MADYANAHRTRFADRQVVPAILTKSGTRLSVQASSGHYCTPREDGAPHYTHFEVWGWHREIPEELRPYSSDGDPAAWVPVDVVNALIERLGGPA